MTKHDTPSRAADLQLLLQLVAKVQETGGIGPYMMTFMLVQAAPDLNSKPRPLQLAAAQAADNYQMSPYR